MTTGTAIVIVGGIGIAAFLYLRSQQQQTAAVAAAQAAPGAGQGGGVTGLAGRLWGNFKSDPLGIHNAEAVARTAGSIVSNAVGTIRGLF